MCIRDRVSSATGFITVQNSYNREICGLGAIFDATVSTLYGLSKTDNPFIVPIAIDAENDFTDIIIHNGVKQAFDYKNAQIDLIMMGDAAFAAYQTYMKESNVAVSYTHLDVYKRQPAVRDSKAEEDGQTVV